MHNKANFFTNWIVTLKIGTTKNWNVASQNKTYIPEEFSWQGHFSSIQLIKIKLESKSYIRTVFWKNHLYSQANLIKNSFHKKNVSVYIYK